MVWSAKLKCDKCKTHIPAGSLVFGNASTKTIQRVYDPGNAASVWRGQVGVTKLRHPTCLPITKRFAADIQEALEEDKINIFQGGSGLPPTLQKELRSWMEQVASPEAEAERGDKRKAAMGLNPDGTKKPRGNFKPKGPPEAWRRLVETPDEIMEKSATALKNFLKTYTYEKVPKSITKQKLVDMIVNLFATDNNS